MKKREVCPHRNKRFSLRRQEKECIKRFGIDSSPCPDNGDVDCTLIPQIEPKETTREQVHQLIQWAKDNGYGLAAEWMVGKTMSGDK